MEIFCCIINDFTVTFDQFNAYLLISLTQTFEHWCTPLLAA